MMEVLNNSVYKQTKGIILAVTNLEVQTFLGAYYLKNENLGKKLFGGFTIK